MSVNIGLSHHSLCYTNTIWVIRWIYDKDQLRVEMSCEDELWDEMGSVVTLKLVIVIPKNYCKNIIKSEFRV